MDLFLTWSSQTPSYPASHLRRVEPLSSKQVGWRRAPRRVIVSSFASHVHRIQQVLDAAHQTGREVARPAGRGPTMGSAGTWGYLKVPSVVVKAEGS
nr:hypothetical protein [Streptomyces sp. DHE17-7]